MAISDEQRFTEQDLLAALGPYRAELQQAGRSPTTVAAYLDNSRKFVRWLAGAEIQPTQQGSRYAPLRRHLDLHPDPAITMGVAEIEAVIGAALPASAHARGWWANDQRGWHVHCRAWLDAGWRVTHVDLTRQLIQFTRAAATPGGDLPSHLS